MNSDSPLERLAFRIHHTMLPVADLDRSIDFYTRLLGMSTMGRRTDDVRKVEVGHVGYGQRDTHPSLELTKDIGDRPPTEVRSTGIHVAIQVSDLGRLCGVLENEHVRFIQALKAGGRDGRRITAWIRDPDGHAIELIEIRSA
jgi:lactoylglutathione lyase